MKRTDQNEKETRMKKSNQNVKDKHYVKDKPKCKRQTKMKKTNQNEKDKPK